MPMSNKAWVKDRESFAIAVQELYNGVYYHVALKSTGMIFTKDEITYGTIEKVSVTTVEPSGSLVKFRFTNKP
jgi:hypothetical protein